jgi:hypothetical protein
LNTGLDFHGLSGLPIYAVWQGMHRRCNNPSETWYHRYGGRGIRVCQRWNSVHAFLEDMGHPEPGQSLGRIDNDGHYEPGNCRWETQEQQNENTCRNRFLAWQGRTQTIKAWAQELDLDSRRISQRLKRGWSVEQALTTPTPLSFEDARADYCGRARALWAQNSRRYRGLPSRPKRRPTAKPERTGKKPTARPQRTAEERAALVAQVRQLKASGASLRAIAAELGISKSLAGLYAA